MTFADFREKLLQKGLEFFSRYYSIYRGTVTDHEDPEKLGRLKIAVPGIYEDTPDYWAWPRGLPSGKGSGLFFIPTKGSAVWVSFEGGDIRFPVWEPGGWRRGEVPATAARQTPDNYVLQTPKGQRLELDDKGEFIRLVNKAGLVFEMNAKGISSGKEDQSKYKSVLGEELVEILKETLLEITKITVVNGAGKTSPPNNLTQFQQISGKLNKILSQKNTLE